MTAAKKIEPKSSVVEAFKVYENFCRSMLDGYVVVDAHGAAVKFNTLFTQLVGLKSKQIMKAKSIDEIIGFYVGHQKLDLLAILNQDNPTRIDEVRGVIKGNDHLNLIVGVYPFHDEDGTATGAFVLLRDVTAETNLQGKYKDAKNLSITDPLTGLFTRGYFEDYLALQSRMLLELPTNSDRRMLSVILVDIDHFKKVNDTYGHQAGDYVLKVTAELMRNCFRKTDVVCRYGGEEFLIILPVTDASGSQAAAEKVRIAVEGERIVFEGSHIPITISAGISQYKLGVETHTEMIARADQALYAAKKGGRNQTKIAP